MNNYVAAMEIIYRGDALPEEYLNHELKGEWAGYSECHVGGDYLLIYQATDDSVIYVDLGTHAELFA